MIEKQQVNFIYERWQHHAEHSGYDMLVPDLGIGLPVIDYRDRRKRLLPWRLVNHFVGPGSGNSHYWHHHFYAELSAALHMFSKQRSIYHILYGDWGYRYLGLMDGFYGNRIVASFHIPPSMLTRFVHTPQYLSRLGAAIVVGKNQIPFLEQYLDQSKIHWIPHGVDTVFFCPLAQPEQIQNDRILFVGQHLRDFETLKKVIEYLEKDKLNVEVALVVPEEMKSEFSAYRSVKVYARLSDAELLALYQASDFMLLPVIDATAMNALVEGMACGLPVIVTDVGGVKDYVDESCAILVPPRNPERMYTAVCEMLSHPEQRKKMGKNSRCKAIQYDWTRVKSQMRELYDKLLR